MSRKGCKNKVHSGIYYPRKCDTCDYISNNPSMFHYHKKTHGSIEGKICSHGCSQPAKFIKTNGKYSCLENTHLCPAYLATQAEQIREQWTRDGAEERKEQTKRILSEVMRDPEIRKKRQNTKRSKTGLLTEERRTIFRRYAYACRKIAQQWAKDNGHEIGQQTFHVDHIYSILDGFTNEIAPAILSHPKNLRILEAKKNSSKGPKSEITLEELLELTKD